MVDHQNDSQARGILATRWRKPFQKALGIAFCAALALVVTYPGVASAAIVDGLDVTFNQLPTADVTTGQTPTSLSPGINYYYFDGVGSLASTGHDWGQTNPFNYSPTLNGSAFSALYNGSATFDYATPETTFGILWGSVDNDNSLSFYHGSTLIGTILGKDLVTAITGAGLSSSQLYWPGAEPTVDITVSTPTGLTSAVVTGAPDLSFEYSNLQSPAVMVTPEPTTFALIGVAALPLLIAIRRRKA